MKLIEAIEILREPHHRESQIFRIGMVCGFNPLHLQTFLTALLRQRFPNRRPEIVGSIYGDFWGSVERVERENCDVCIILLEWGDIDPRLGIRGLGSWVPGAQADILANARARSAQFEKAIRAMSPTIPVVISFPTLPLPPVSFAQGWQASTFELELRSIISNLSLEVAGITGVKVISQARLDRISQVTKRLDVNSELLAGFPFRLPHASALAELLCDAIDPPLPKKGLITDLDDTFWSGILGEVGVESVSWDLEHGSHMHGVYQRMLHALSESGTLVAAASKNSSDAVENALRRDDLLLPNSALFPVEANWGPKSHSITRILKTWNVGPDSVVFIDDSPMELAEVKAQHPDIECILFPKDDAQAIEELMYRLRDLFGKTNLSEEDTIRRESIRQSRIRDQQSGSGVTSVDEFLKQAEAELTLNFCSKPMDPRALELVNKTNQFNLNGKRYTESNWQDCINHPDAVFVLASYRNKYGPLGKIAVIAGRKLDRKLSLKTWVMSCRAFSRRIEHGCLKELFERYDVDQIELDFENTPRNGPIRDFLADLLGEAPKPNCVVSRAHFMNHYSTTFQKIVEIANG